MELVSAKQIMASVFVRQVNLIPNFAKLKAGKLVSTMLTLSIHNAPDSPVSESHTCTPGTMIYTLISHVCTKHNTTAYLGGWHSKKYVKRNNLRDMPRFRFAAGWTGPDCKERQLRPCTNKYRESAAIKEPTSHVGLSGSSWTASRCAGQESVLGLFPLFYWSQPDRPSLMHWPTSAWNPHYCQICKVCWS